MKCDFCGEESDSFPWRIDAPGAHLQFCSAQCIVDFIYRIQDELGLNLTQWIEGE